VEITERPRQPILPPQRSARVQNPGRKLAIQSALGFVVAAEASHLIRADALRRFLDQLDNQSLGGLLGVLVKLHG
jgi:hypothetical protein